MLRGHPVPTRDFGDHDTRRRRLREDAGFLAIRPAAAPTCPGDDLHPAHRPGRVNHILKHMHKTIRVRERQLRPSARLRKGAVQTSLTMKLSWKLVLRALADESGATMVEYGLMLLFIALVCFATVRVLGNMTLGLFTRAILP